MTPVFILLLFRVILVLFLKSSSPQLTNVIVTAYLDLFACLPICYHCFLSVTPSF